MKTQMTAIAATLMLGLFAVGAYAVPVLQVGAPAGPGDTGTYADYQGSTTNPSEDDTAITSGGTLYVSGLYQTDSVLNLGGQYTGGLDWDEITDNQENFIFPGLFDGRGAILVVSLPETFLTSAASILTVGGNTAFMNDANNSYFPNNHAPTNDSASGYLFFDIGDFSKSVPVPDFADETAGTKLGEIKTLVLGGFDDLTLGLPWAHFDVMALQTGTQGQTSIVTTIQNNPGSHDVTWKTSSSSSTSGGASGSTSTSGGASGSTSGNTVPEPGMLALLGIGLLGQGLILRQRRRHLQK